MRQVAWRGHFEIRFIETLGTGGGHGNEEPSFIQLTCRASHDQVLSHLLLARPVRSHFVLSVLYCLI